MYKVFEVYVVPLIYFSVEVVLVLEFTVGATRYLKEKIDFNETWYT